MASFYRARLSRPVPMPDAQAGEGAPKTKLVQVLGPFSSKYAAKKAIRAAGVDGYVEPTTAAG